MPTTTEMHHTFGGTPVWITGEGPSVVLIHGVQMDHRMWDAQVAALSDGYRVLCIDMLGHGDALGPDGERTLGNFTGQVGEVVSEVCEGERPVIGGFSMGAIEAINAAAAFAAATAAGASASATRVGPAAPVDDE